MNGGLTLREFAELDGSTADIFSNSRRHVGELALAAASLAIRLEQPLLRL